MIQARFNGHRYQLDFYQREYTTALPLKRVNASRHLILVIRPNRRPHRGMRGARRGTTVGHFLLWTRVPWH